MKTKHKVTSVDMQFASCYVVNWFENDQLVEAAILDYKEMLYFIDLIKLANDK